MADENPIPGEHPVEPARQEVAPKGEQLSQADVLGCAAFYTVKALETSGANRSAALQKAKAWINALQSVRFNFDNADPLAGDGSPAPVPATSDETPDVAIEETKQQTLGDDTCGECAAVFAAMKAGVIPATAPNAQSYVDQLWAAVNPGIPETERGTDLGQEEQCFRLLAEWRGATVDIQRVVRSSAQGFIDQGYMVALGVDLSVIDPQVSGYHWLLFDAEGNGVLHDLDSAHDIDAGLGHPDQNYPADAVLNAAEALFGVGTQIGWAVKFGG